MSSRESVVSVLKEGDGCGLARFREVKALQLPECRQTIEGAWALESEMRGESLGLVKFGVHRACLYKAWYCTRREGTVYY